jgi:AraC-like DNA-binding protein
LDFSGKTDRWKTAETTKYQLMIRAEKIESALQDRVFTLSTGPVEARSWRGILLQSGNGSIRGHTGEFPFSQYSCVWAPWTEESSLWISAGTMGVQFALSADILLNAIGHNAQSSELRHMAERRLVAQYSPDSPNFSDIEHAFATILRESELLGRGYSTMVEAQLRIILVALWRETNADTAPTTLGRSAALLQHFRQLVEINFQNRWPVSAYAREIGISADRLNDVCNKTLGRPPKLLLQERCQHEARLMLENTSLTVDQIAGRLGFRDAAYFSRFFKQQTGLPPATYRRTSATAGIIGPDVQVDSFADWP